MNNSYGQHKLFPERVHHPYFSGFHMYILFLDETSCGNSREHIVLTPCIFQLAQSFVKKVWWCPSEYGFVLSGAVMCNCFALSVFPLCLGILLLDLAVVPN